MNEIKEELYQSMMNGDLTISSSTSKEILDYLDKQEKEITRLNNIIDELEKWLNEAKSGDISFAYTHTLQKLKELKKRSDKDD